MIRFDFPKATSVTNATQFFFYLAVCLFSIKEAAAQTRAADSIFTVRKDTLVVQIKEVRLHEVIYDKVDGDTSERVSIPKSQILKIAFGNGDVENFDQSSRASDPDKRYEMVATTPFQQEITEWSTERLLIEKKEFRAKANSRLATGVVAVVAGSALCAFGLLASAFGDGASGAAALVAGVALGAGAAIPLHISGAKNRLKYKLVKQELIRRGVEKY